MKILSLAVASVLALSLLADQSAFADTSADTSISAREIEQKAQSMSEPEMRDTLLQAAEQLEAAAIDNPDPKASTVQIELAQKLRQEAASEGLKDKVVSGAKAIGAGILNGTIYVTKVSLGIVFAPIAFTGGVVAGLADKDSMWQLSSLEEGIAVTAAVIELFVAMIVTHPIGPIVFTLGWVDGFLLEAGGGCDSLGNPASCNQGDAAKVYIFEGAESAGRRAGSWLRRTYLKIKEDTERAAKTPGGTAGVIVIP